MKLSTIFSHLTFGELKQFGIGGYEDYKEIQPDNYEEVVNHINLALLNLYTRFPILEKEDTFPTEEGKTLYPLPEDCIRVNAVFCDGTELPLNDEYAETSAFISSFNELQLPFATGSETIYVIYQAEPVPVTGTTLTEEVNLPDSLLEALLAYVEYRVRKSQGGQEGVQLAMAAKQTYEMMCVEIEKHNVFNSADASKNLKPELNGWV